MADPIAVNLPKLSLAMAEGTLSDWLVEDGSTVAEGDAIYLVESDKVEVEIESPASGRLEQHAAPGETYRVGEQLGIIHTL